MINENFTSMKIIIHVNVHSISYFIKGPLMYYGSIWNLNIRINNKYHQQLMLMSVYV